MTYEELLMEADKQGLIVKEKPLQGNDGRIRGKRIAIRRNIDTTAEKACVLAEEFGHYVTSTGNIIDMSDEANRKEELRARLYGYNMQIGLIGIIRAFEEHRRTLSEMAEYFNVPEKYMIEVLDCYRSKYGIYTQVDNYVIYFIPTLSVVKIIAE